MALKYDPEFARILEVILPNLPKRESLDLDNIAAARQQRGSAIKAAYERLPESPDVEERWHYARSSDDALISIHEFRKTDDGAEASSAIIHFHGGGLVLGSSELFARGLASLVSQTSVPIFSVNYRLAPEYKGSTLVEDCYAAITWIYDHAKDLRINKSRIGLLGESAGGALAVGAALMARDRNLQPPLAKQILVYPMLDDRTTIPNPAVEPLAFWKTEDNATAWEAVLGTNPGQQDIDNANYVVPARASDFAQLPPAYIDVGSLDIFRDEDIEYARRLLDCNVEVELHVYPGLPHAFEMIAPNITATKKANENRLRAILSF